MEHSLYKATFIINLRATKRSIDELSKWLQSVVTELGGKVEGVEDLGVRDFSRVTHKENPTGHYLAITFKATGDINAGLQQKLKLETEVKRTFVEKVNAPVKA